ncbi:helix-turn-helix domain-containing protein [Dokdonia sp. Asnod1-B02]|uniref:helix-turn-helix domain-containing protein n=1 Tax=Dokdonia sp. Asnod1-B02 TaxID=3160573 RepID=UPI0038705C37
MAKKQRITQPSEFCLELGKHLRALRKSKDLSIEEIAYKANIDAQNLRKYELGKQEMKIGMLKRIADAFEITPSELIDFKIN